MIERLEEQLNEMGIRCRIEARERLALLIPEPGTALSAEFRHRVIDLTRAAGFTHVAIEIAPGATLSGD